MSPRVSIAVFAIINILGAGAACADGSATLCTDRPGKNSAPCTVDEGRFQLEWNLADGTFQHRAGVTTDLWQTTPSLKYGLAPDWDIEATLPLAEDLRTHGAGTDDTHSGIGDLVLASQWAFYKDNIFAAGVRGFVKIPTAADAIGNGKVEGGVLVPMTLALDDDWSLGSTPEIDLVANGDGSGRHARGIDALGINRTLGDGFTVGAEIWTVQDFDPAGTAAQYSADLTAAWLMDPSTQFDAGVYFGLDKQTPDVEISIGISRRL
jgi:hypothetical protein